MSDVTRAIILAAGLGTRLKSFTQHTPKALMSVAGQPAIVHVIRQLVAQGIHDIAINIHHHAQQLPDYLGNGSKYHANLHFSHEKTLLDSGGGVRTALDLLPEASAGLVAVYNADIMANIDMARLAKICPDGGCALALVANPKHHPRGDFGLRRGYVQQNALPRFTFAGVSLWHEDALLAYAAQRAFSLVEPIRHAIDARRCTGFVDDGYWFDIGRPRDLIQANTYLSRREG